MKGKMIGVLTVITVGAFIATASITLLSHEFFKAFNAQLALFLFIGSIVMTGAYLLKKHITRSSKIIQNLIILFGLIVWVFGGLVVFNILPIRSTFHWLIVGGIAYTLFVELQLLGWGKEQATMPKIMSFIVILTSLFLITYFMAQWRFSGLQFWITLAVFTNIGACILGSFFPTQQKTPNTNLHG